MLLEKTPCLKFLSCSTACYSVNVGCRYFWFIISF